MSGIIHTKEFSAFVDSEIGLTMGEIKVEQKMDGTWRVSSPIDTIFGSEVDGEISGEGATKDAAIEAYQKSRKNLNDSLWV